MTPRPSCLWTEEGNQFPNAQHLVAVSFPTGCFTATDAAGNPVTVTDDPSSGISYVTRMGLGSETYAWLLTRTEEEMPDGAEIFAGMSPCGLEGQIPTTFRIRPPLLAAAGGAQAGAEGVTTVVVLALNGGTAVEAGEDVKVKSVRWEKYEPPNGYGQDLPNLDLIPFKDHDIDTLVIYPDKRHYWDAAQGGFVEDPADYRNKVNIVVELEQEVTGNKPVTVYVRVFDPDDPSTNDGPVDANGVLGG